MEETSAVGKYRRNPNGGSTRRDIRRAPHSSSHTLFPANERSSKTSLLSPAWLEAWRTRSTLEFVYKDLLSSSSTKSAVLLTNYIHTTIQRYSDRKISIDRLKLKQVRNVVPKSVISESIRVAIENNVKTLHLHLSPSYHNPIGQDVFGGKSIVNLKLCFCELNQMG